MNLYAMPDNESFLQAVLLVPRSLTADCNFPDWNYHGRGSGEGRRYHRYRAANRLQLPEDAEPQAAGSIL